MMGPFRYYHALHSMPKKVSRCPGVSVSLAYHFPETRWCRAVYG